MHKRGRDKRFSNRLLYSLIALGIIAILSVGVYATTYTASGGGHPYTEISTCSIEGQILKMSGGAWTCGIDAGGIATETDPTVKGWAKTDTPTIPGPMIVSNSITAEDFGAAGSKNVVVGDDAYLSDLDEVDTLGIKGIQGTAAAGWAIVKAGQFVYASDRALKTNIQPLQNSLEKVQQLNGVSFNWKSSGEKSIGLIAQDVEKVLPELVSGSEGNKAVAYGNIVAVLIEAIKEQQKQIDELKNQVQELKER